MDYRENLVRAMRRQSPAFVPFEFNLVSTLADRVRVEAGVDDPFAPFVRDAYHARQGIKGVGPAPSQRPVDYSAYYRDRTFPRQVTINEWGIARQAGTYMHFTHIESPLSGATSRAEIERYPAPDLDAEYRYAGVAQRVQELHDAGFAVTGHVGHTFETAWQIRGMEAFLTDLAMNRDWCEALVAKIAAVNMVKIRHLAESGVDVLRIGDDVGTQKGMMFAPDVWRAVFKPRLQAYIALAKSVHPDVLIWYHSDGDVRAIIPDLIEIGLDILNPVQPECMDPVAIKREYGRHLSLWGTIGTQTVMPHGSAADVRETVQRYIDQVGYDGGLCLAPTHVLEPEVPLANIHAFVDAIAEYGLYASP